MRRQDAFVLEKRSENSRFGDGGGPASKVPDAINSAIGKEWTLPRRQCLANGRRSSQAGALERRNWNCRKANWADKIKAVCRLGGGNSGERKISTVVDQLWLK
jgi:hypothetical protein